MNGLKEGAAEWLESKRCKKPSHVEEGETKHRRHKHSPRERRNGSMPVGYSGRRTSKQTSTAIAMQ
jgi:hypothetical protein